MLAAVGFFAKRVKGFDHYRRAMLAVLPLALFVLLYLVLNGLLFHATDFLLPEWFLNFFVIPAFVGNILSGSTYIARTIDINRTTLKSSQGVGYERILTTIGLGLGITASIVLLALHITIPCAASLNFIADGCFLLNAVSVFSGLGNRLGNCIDTNSKPKNEKYTIGIASLCGFAIALALVLTSTAALVSIAGVTTFLTGGAALPFWIGSGIFIISFTSSFASAADYSTKAANFIKSQSTNDASIKQTVGEKFHEYRGSCIGVGVGLVLGVAITVALFITMPYVFVGIAGIVAATMIVMTSVSVLGGLFSRTGKLFDGFKNKKTNLDDKPKDEPPEQLPSSPAGKNELATSARVMNTLQYQPRKLTRAESYPNLITLKNSASKANDSYHGAEHILLKTPARNLRRTQSLNDLEQCKAYKMC